jgi:hypothetical protein
VGGCNIGICSNLQVYGSLNTLLAVLKWKGTIPGVRAEEKISVSRETKSSLVYRCPLTNLRFSVE